MRTHSGIASSTTGERFDCDARTKTVNDNARDLVFLAWLGLICEVANFYAQALGYSAKEIVSDVNLTCFDIAQVRLAGTDHERKFLLGESLRLPQFAYSYA